MKIFNYITVFLTILMFVVSCEPDEKTYSFENLAAPTNVSVVFDVTQDNSGLVTIFPNADGATKYLIAFGDTIDETPTEYKVGEEITHVYKEGTYTVGITAVGIDGKKTSIEENLVVSFQAPENLVITVENDIAVSKKVNISATADYATTIEVYFGELADDTAVVTTPGETVSHVYAEPGDYDITVIAKSAAIETLDSTFTFTVTEITGPLEPAPTPPGRIESDYISVFSDVYTNLTGTDFNPNWGQSTIVTQEEVVDGDMILKYTNLNYQGTQFENPIDASGMEYLHVDMWTEDATSVKFYTIDGVAEKGYELAVTPETWVSYDIPLSYFDNVDLSSIIQFKVDDNGTGEGATVYFDNIYFYIDNVVTEPTEAAPAPTEAEANVISMFSDAYTDVTVDTWRTDWSSATLEDVDVVGNATKKYSALDFVGIETASSQIDATDMTHFHLDVWSADITTFKIKLVDFGPDGAYGGGDDVEHELTYDTPAQGEWVSYDIPLSDFTNLTTRANLAQYILVGQPTGETTIWVDNVYFYDGSVPTEPTEAAPTPTEAEANVISMFSDAYTDVTVDTWRTDWSSATLEDVDVAGNATKKYSALDFVGIETASSQIDATDMTHFHLDVWSADITTFKIKLVDFGPDGAYGGGDDVEHELTYDTPAQGEWVSYDIPLSDFTNLTTRANLTQYILVGQPTGESTIWIDNVYFHK